MLVKTEAVELTPASEEEAARISRILNETYGLLVSANSVERFLEKTASSSVFRCRLFSGEYAVVKESFWHQDDEVFDSLRSLKKAYEISESLRLRGVALPMVFPAKTGELAVLAGSAKIAVLEFLNGSHFSSADWQFEAAGSALAGFHRSGKKILAENPAEYNSISQSIPVEKSYEESREMYKNGLRERLIAPHDCRFPEVCGSVRENIQYIDDAIRFIDGSGVNNSSLRRGILHNDFGTNNTLVNEADKKAYFLDIDQVGVGPFVWDLGNTLASYASNYLSRGLNGNFEPKARLFLEAYHSIFPLPPEEYMLILAATQRWDVMRVLRTMRRHHLEDDRLQDLVPKVSERFIPRIKAIPKFFSFFTKEWFASII